MKILILGDIHGRLHWLDVIQKEQPDLTIFLGDYVSTHDDISAEQQLSNLEDILNYKEENPDKVILLRGNHDTQHLGYYWARCSGLDSKVFDYMSQPNFRERFLALTQWIYIVPDTNIVCSHAGISKEFLNNVNKHIKFEPNEPRNYINEIEKINSIEPCELFGFTACKFSDNTGESATQPCTWIRPGALAYHALEGITYIVGHTPVQHIINARNEAFIKNGCYPAYGPEMWLCDCLEYKEYLTIEDGKFITKTF